jgi:hypothetical protein
MTDERLVAVVESNVECCDAAHGAGFAPRQQQILVTTLKTILSMMGARADGRSIVFIYPVFIVGIVATVMHRYLRYQGILLLTLQISNIVYWAIGNFRIRTVQGMQVSYVDVW